MATLIHANDPKSFQTEVIESKIPVLVDFWAAWCGPCRMVAPEVDAIAQAHDGDLKVVKVDVDANPEPAARYNVMGIPTIGLFRDGKLVATSVGAKPRKRIEKELGIEAAKA